MTHEVDAAQRSGAGQVLCAPDWLDDHFEACRAWYEQMVRVAGLQQGWAVLDAGSGSGSFLPLLREQIGEHGRLVAFDLDDENVRISREPAVIARADPGLGSVTALPFASGSFDAAWAANVAQYFDDEALPEMLREMARVVRPGGLVVVKDVDMSALRIHPGDPLLGARLAEACATTPPVAQESIGSLRGRVLRRWLERQGLVDVVQHTFPIEYWAPLEPVAVRLWSSWLPYLAALAVEHRVPDADLETWRELADAERARAFVESPEFYACELQVVAVGRVPETPS